MSDEVKIDSALAVREALRISERLMEKGLLFFSAVFSVLQTQIQMEIELDRERRKAQDAADKLAMVEAQAQARREEMFALPRA